MSHFVVLFELYVSLQFVTSAFDRSQSLDQRLNQRFIANEGRQNAQLVGSTVQDLAKTEYTQKQYSCLGKAREFQSSSEGIVAYE